MEDPFWEHFLEEENFNKIIKKEPIEIPERVKSQYAMDTVHQKREEIIRTTFHFAEKFPKNETLQHYKDRAYDVKVHPLDHIFQ